MPTRPGSTGCRAGGRRPRVGVLWFLAVTFANGVLIEIGRKLRAPADERTGVDTYTHAWGPRVAPLAWVGTLAASAWLSLRASQHVGWPSLGVALFVAVAVAASVPAFVFVRGPKRAGGLTIERVSQAGPGAHGVWARAGPPLTSVSRAVLPLVARAVGRGASGRARRRRRRSCSTFRARGRCRR